MQLYPTKKTTKQKNQTNNPHPKIPQEAKHNNYSYLYHLKQCQEILVTRSGRSNFWHIWEEELKKVNFAQPLRVGTAQTQHSHLMNPQTTSLASGYQGNVWSDTRVKNFTRKHTRNPIVCA